VHEENRLTRNRTFQNNMQDLSITALLRLLGGGACLCCFVWLAEMADSASLCVLCCDLGVQMSPT
jgi:hypothetical protein